MDLTKYIKPESVFFFKGGHKKEILNLLIDKALHLGYIDDADAFRGEIEGREARISTGIGDGVAIPHAKLPEIEDFFVIAAILEEPVGWDALDQKPVSLIFLIGGPETDQTTYLQILAKLMGVVKNEQKREALISSKEESAVAALFA